MEKASKEYFKTFVNTLAGDIKDIEDNIKNGDKFTGIDPEFDKVRLKLWNVELEVARYCKSKVEEK